MIKRPLIAACAALIVFGMMTASPGVAAPRQSASVDNDWLGWLNHYRGLANLPPVVEEAALSDGAMKHARYMKMTGQFGHAEDPASPWYTEEGNTAGNNGLLGRDDPNWRSFMENYASMMFHGLNLLSPQITRVGFGTYENYSTLQLRGPAERPWEYYPNLPEPITWPGDGKSVALTTLVGEAEQSNLTCPNAQHGVSGLPIKVFFRATPSISAVSLSSDGTALGTCRFDETNYRHQDQAWQDLGRAILQGTHGLVIVPNAPLQAGKTYTVSVTNKGQVTTWSFSVVPRSSVTSPTFTTPAPRPSSPSPTASATATASAGPTAGPQPTASPTGAVSPSPDPAPSPSVTRESTTSLLWRTRGDRYIVTGSVEPPDPGATVDVRLFTIRNGTRTQVARKSVTLGAESSYRTRFSRPRAPRCAIIVRYRGNATVGPSASIARGEC